MRSANGRGNTPLPSAASGTLVYPTSRSCPCSVWGTDRFRGDPSWRRSSRAGFQPARPVPDRESCAEWR
jgi:hypothetical protein